MRFTLSTPQPHFAEVVLFRDIQNAAEVVDAMKKGNVQAALVDARLVSRASLLQIRIYVRLVTKFIELIGLTTVTVDR